ncbi:hypothetical protein OQA88_4553 [Cercophora sp. LCS_1]
MEAINPSVPFDPFAIPFGSPDATYGADFSPASLFSPLDDFNADFASDSAGSPASPLSPSALSGSSYGVPPPEDWASWDQLPNSDALFSSMAFGGPVLGSTPMQKLPMSPAVNPMDLTILPSAQAGFPTAPVFRSPQPTTANVPALPSVPEIPVDARADQQDAASKRYPSRNLKRKSSASASEDDEGTHKRTSPSPPPAARSADKAAHQMPKKTAHNMIEKRYRTNLNDKITQLRDAVPALRVVAQRCDNGIGGEDAEDYVEEEYAGLPPIVPKLNKATILSKATEYISQLERRNRSLETENSALRGRMEGLEMLLMSRGGSTGVWN